MYVKLLLEPICQILFAIDAAMIPLSESSPVFRFGQSPLLICLLAVQIHRNKKNNLSVRFQNTF